MGPDGEEGVVVVGAVALLDDAAAGGALGDGAAGDGGGGAPGLGGAAVRTTELLLGHFWLWEQVGTVQWSYCF